MRAWWIVLLLAGCLDPEPVASEGPMPDPLPEPRDAHPDDLVGRDVVGVPERDHRAATWREECIRQWSSLAYVFAEPPVVDERPCLFYPTEKGTLHWFLVDSDNNHSSTQQAAPLERADGGWDWVYVHLQDKTLYFVENGTRHVPLASLRVADPEREIVSAARLGDEVHVTVVDSPWGPPDREHALHHYWFDPAAAEDVQHEVLAGTNAITDAPRLRVAGNWLVTVSDRIEGAHVYATQGGAFLELPVPGARVPSVDATGNDLWGCAVRGGTYFGMHVRLPSDGPPVMVPTFEPVAVSPFADLAFTCGVAVAKDRPTLFIDSPAAVGGGPNPLGGIVAYTRSDLLGWEASAIGFQYHSGADAAAVQDRVFHLGETGNGTATGDRKNGTELRTPVEDPTGKWTRVWGDFGRTTRFVDHDDRLLVLGEVWANPPFEYPDFDSHGRVSWAVVDVP